MSYLQGSCPFLPQGMMERGFLLSLAIPPVFHEYPEEVYGENLESGCKLLFYLSFPVFYTFKLAHIDSLAIC